MNDNDSDISRLGYELSDAYYGDDAVRTAQIAEELAARLGDPTPQRIKEYIQVWILLWDALGNFEEAIRLEHSYIANLLSELEAGDYDPYAELLAETVDVVQGCLYLQADRYLKLGNMEQAISCLRELYSLAERYAIGPDEEARSLMAQLTSKSEG